MKTHFKTLQNPNYLGSWDLVNEDGTFKEVAVTIKEVSKQMVFDGKGGQEECTTIAFNECKPMVANSTNLKMIARVCGSNFIEDWAGKQIVIGVEKVRAFGEIHDALRVRKVKPTLPALTADHAKFAAVKKAIETGTATMADARLKFVISAEVEQMLTGGAK